MECACFCTLVPIVASGHTEHKSGCQQRPVTLASTCKNQQTPVMRTVSPTILRHYFYGSYSVHYHFQSDLIDERTGCSPMTTALWSDAECAGSHWYRTAQLSVITAISAYVVLFARACQPQKQQGNLAPHPHLSKCTHLKLCYDLWNTCCDN